MDIIGLHIEEMSDGLYVKLHERIVEIGAVINRAKGDGVLV